MTLTFDLYVILLGQGRRFYSKWSKLSMIDSKKVGNDFIEVSKLSGAITAIRGPQILSV